MSQTGINRIAADYHENGYAVLKNVFSPDEVLNPVMIAYDAYCDSLAEKWLADGTIGTYEPHDTTENKMLSLMRQTDGNCFQSLDITLPVEDTIRKDSPLYLDETIFRLLRHPRLLDAIEQIIGPEIYSVPVQHMRIKPPQKNITQETRSHTLTLTGKTFWHQDLAVVTPDADRTSMLGVWLPINEATEENGCLIVVPGSHKGGLVHHCDKPHLQGIPDELVGEDFVALPVRPGDAIFLHPLTMHASLANASRGGRWSFDLRYCPTGQPTGREWFPGFVARSRNNPVSELKDHASWVQAWHNARFALAGQPHPKFDRWDKHDRSPLCA
ncbi:phytanoyl-CoA dioxygenase family protein [Brenneria rubrifaciens]|uniref:Phytanoyl-CoA dioxygenase family protein n=1 Tax=Brenneria rubrifaciens TaxID=55213 RepID=A0A4P8QKP5_9GAMM|nr:phytanoyl-CoA dioxygenase family protein [Brenneria rubrifaciens]QCR07418.1 phytanoyl-CoA dioxygenase family protein [Brenneria rubrifaciens]